MRVRIRVRVHWQSRIARCSLQPPPALDISSANGFKIKGSALLEQPWTPTRLVPWSQNVALSSADAPMGVMGWDMP